MRNQETLSLNSEVLDRNFYQVMYDGMLITVFPLITFLFISAFIAYLFSYAILPAYVDYFRGNFGKKRNLAKVRRKFFGKRAPYPIEVFARRVSLPIIVISFFFIFAIFSFAYFENKGVNAANDLIAAINSKNSTIIRASIEGEKVDMYFLGCGDTLCAAVEVENDRIHYIDPELYSFESFNRTNP